MTARTWLGGLVCAAATFLVAACGGGGGGSGSATPAATPAVSYAAKLNVTSAEVGVGRTVTISAVAVDNSGNDVTSSTSFAWTSVDTAVASVAGSTATIGSAVITGVNPGTTTVQVVATVKAADNSTVQLPAQSATITVVPASATTYSLSVPNTSLSMTDGQSLPVKVSLVDNNGNDVSANGSGWAWSSSGTAVQVTPNQNSATLKASNSSTTAAATANVSVSVTAPDGRLLGGVIFVTVQKNGTATYRVVTTQNGDPVNALQVLSTYPARFSARVLRNDDQDVTADFDGTWTYVPTSSTLSASEAAGTHDVTVSTSLAKGAGPVQGTLTVTAISTKLAAKPTASLNVVENPEWALMPDVQQPLTLTMLGIPIPVTVGLKHFGDDQASTACTGWTWVPAGPITLSPGVGDNQKIVSPMAAGDFTITVSCTNVADGKPVTVKLVGTVK
ncbi:hypothetical protein LMG31506_03378 [Cupriavidus yeoncheonensis]|uniref:BIG2 domain-containing protein n=1 Tax=Cupriavidus yeoncheonensis TaxID=1462994 RepID=A0A916MYH4_9BURK|nr:hypothetical protein [Cupriavidus yeoncheonensis]CAG2146305.1 hypothetical protein LMG31506_03378 [Cupriavidus yeoncheonensis]